MHPKIAARRADILSFQLREQLVISVRALLEYIQHEVTRLGWPAADEIKRTMQAWQELASRDDVSNKALIDLSHKLVAGAQIIEREIQVARGRQSQEAPSSQQAGG